MKPNSFPKLNKELAELVGAFIGDGFIGKYDGHYHVEFAGNPKLDNDYFQYLSKIITDHFEVKPRVRFYSGAIRLLITYKEFHRFFIALGFKNGIKNNTVYIPHKLYESTLIKYAVRGLFDTDGYIYVDKRLIYKKPYARIGYSTKSKKLYDQLRLFFIKRDYNLYCRVDKRYNIFNIELYGNSQVSKWLKEFGFSNTKKRNYASVAQLVER